MEARISAGSSSPAHHVRVGHPRHGHVRIALAPAIAGDAHAHQSRIQPVLQVASQDAVLDEDVAPRGLALVIHGERPAAFGEGAVVDDGDAFRAHLLADAVRKGRRPLAVEIALESVADGLVQEDARPARSQHHRHGSRRGGARLEVHQRLPHRGIGHLAEALVGEMSVAESPAAAAVALLAPAVLLHDHGDREVHERAHVRGAHAVDACHEDHLVLAREAPDHLLHARIGGAGAFLQPLQKAHLLGIVQRGDGVDRRV